MSALEHKYPHELWVYSDLGRIGRLWLDEQRHFAFQYDAEWLNRPDAFAISLTLPLVGEPVLDDRARAFFSNLLPEALVRRKIAESLGVSERNDFALLEALGGECAGALMLWAPHETPTTDGSYREVTAVELTKMIGEMARRPLLAGQDGIRLSLAGAQEKLPVFVEYRGEGETSPTFLLPTGNSASSHILKPAIADYVETVENEAFCMRLARRAELDVPPVNVVRLPLPVFLIARYDRITRKTNLAGPARSLARIHQEDFCQALGFSEDQKYESEGGPKIADCFRLLGQKGTRPALDKKRLIEWAVFNYLIGNMDGHAKNLSLLYRQQGIELAPFYDLMSTLVYPELSLKLAMRIGGENRPDWLRRRHWERFAEDISAKPKLILEIARKLGQRLPGLAQDEARAFIPHLGGAKIVPRIQALIEAQATRLVHELS